MPPPSSLLEGSSVAHGMHRGLSRMVLIQLLLPASSAAVSGKEPTPLARTREELAARFDGLTAYLRSPATGLWTAPDGRREQDEVVMVEIVTDRFDRRWWRGYTATLAERFRQEAIHVRALPVEMLDETAARAVRRTRQASTRR